MAKLWTKQQDAILCRMWKETRPDGRLFYTLEEIAKALNKSRDAISNRRMRLKLPRRFLVDYQWSEEQREQFKRMWYDGVAVDVIAFKLNKSEGAIKNTRRALKLPARRRGSKTRKVSIMVTEENYRLLARIARERNTNVAFYINGLIARDVIEHKRRSSGDDSSDVKSAAAVGNGASHQTSPRS